MIIIHEISTDVYDKINTLIELKKYQNIETFLDISIKNQLTIEQSYDDSKKTWKKGNELFRYLKNVTDKPLTVQSRLSKNEFHEPLSGLINRYSPSKIILRTLSNFILERKNQFIDYKEFCNSLISLCTNIRSILDKIEQKENKYFRGKSLKVGLPQNNQKSRQRFLDFYIGSFSSKKNDGLLSTLNFIAVYNDKNTSSPVIGLTEEGYKFSSLKSPLIDDLIILGKTISNPLSIDEIFFILNHLKNIEHGEFSFSNYLYESIKDGYNTPQKLNLRTIKYFGNKNLSASTINNLKTGALSRLVELNLIQITRKGIYTTYKLVRDYKSLYDWLATNTERLIEN